VRKEKKEKKKKREKKKRKERKEKKNISLKYDSNTGPLVSKNKIRVGVDKSKTDFSVRNPAGYSINSNANLLPDGVFCFSLVQTLRIQTFNLSQRNPPSRS